MDMYMHDGAGELRFVLRGELTGDPVRNLEHAWNTARSVLGGRQPLVDISGVKRADEGASNYCLACASQGSAW